MSAEVDWSSIEEVCQQRTVALDKNDPDFLRIPYQYDRARLSDRYPVEHKTNCNLHPDYSKDPAVWARGCDCGAITRAAQRRP